MNITRVQAILICRMDSMQVLLGHIKFNVYKRDMQCDIFMSIAT